MTARDLKAIQEATIARVKWANLGGSEGWDNKSQRVSCTLFEKKGKRGRTGSEKKRERRKAGRKASEFSAGSN